MITACIADSHLGPSEPFLRHLKELENLGTSRFIFLGDIFHYYVGIPSWTDYVDSEILQCWSQRKNNGMDIIYLEGNRDFFLKDSPLSHSVTEVSTRFTVDLQGCRVLFEHGDLINRKDRQYFLWRSISKSFLVYRLLKLFPARWLKPLMDRTERRLKQTNFSYRDNLPWDEIEQFSIDHSDFDLIVLGHFHKRVETTLKDNKIILMPSWSDDPTALLLSDTGDIQWHTLVST